MCSTREILFLDTRISPNSSTENTERGDDDDTDDDDDTKGQGDNLPENAGDGAR